MLKTNVINSFFSSLTSSLTKRKNSLYLCNKYDSACIYYLFKFKIQKKFSINLKYKYYLEIVDRWFVSYDIKTSTDYFNASINTLIKIDLSTKSLSVFKNIIFFKYKLLEMFKEICLLKVGDTLQVSNNYKKYSLKLVRINNKIAKIKSNTLFYD